MIRNIIKSFFCEDIIFGLLALAVMIIAPFVIDATDPPERTAEDPIIQAAENPDIGIAIPENLLSDSAAELWSSDSRLDLEPDYSYIPLDKSLVNTLVTSCEEWGVPLELALAVIEQESGFDPGAVNPVSGCYGLTQISPKWFPSGLTPVENIEAGIGYLGELLALYEGDQARAVTAYYYGPSDRTSSWYSDEVLARKEGWK